MNKVCGSVVSNGRPMGYLKLPVLKYKVASQLQAHLVARRHGITQGTWKTDAPSDILCLLQHPPTFTAGRRIRDHQDSERLKALGADYFETMRGGELTFHGPGQMMAYPILDIRDYQLSVKCYVSRLEKSVIETCKKYGVETNTTEHTGVWVGQEKKIAALGVHLQRYVSSHGLALNCDVDLKWFEQIVACGLVDKKVTSLSLETGRHVTVEEVIPDFVQSFGQTFQKEMVAVEIQDILPPTVVEELGLCYK
ncbi:hypothetical protein INT47_012479 [Mucor saturninus]|uniref:Octanoyltransferase n=1 Tax=Mucor saturninus TaxID=64648 RepID=A0A8H7QJ65_9FUNG|nr:hypothetical protein INT47_012479 [Mucor saturninus]